MEKTKVTNKMNKIIVVRLGMHCVVIPPSRPSESCLVFWVLSFRNDLVFWRNLLCDRFVQERWLVFVLLVWPVFCMLKNDKTPGIYWSEKLLHHL